MPISIKRIKIDLKASQPDKITTSVLQKQLSGVGLNCEDAKEEKLANYIDEVRNSLPRGKIETFGIFQPKTPSLPAGAQRAPGIMMSSLFHSATGSWSAGGGGKVGSHNLELEFIQFEEHFDWLMRNVKNFTGIKNNPPVYENKHDNVKAIKDLFVKVGTVASSSLIEGLKKDELEAILSNIIAPLDDSNAKDYDVKDSRVIFLVKDYDSQTGNAEAIGVLTIEWHLIIENYKEKKTALQHKSQLTIKARSVNYSDIEAMMNHVAQIESSLRSLPSQSIIYSSPTENADVSYSIPIKKSSVDIFPSLPPANRDTFIRSLPKVANTISAEVIVLYSPNLKNIGVIENTNSSATTTYTQSLTSGFTFQMSQQFSAETYFEASVEVVKAGMKIGFSLSFTEQWSKSQTETFNFSVPPGKKAFTYQGYMLARILRFNAKDRTYEYDNEIGQFITNILTTSENPLIN